MSILTDLQGALKGKWRYLIPAEPPNHNHMLIPNYQDFKIQDFRYSDGFECFQDIKIIRIVPLFDSMLIPQGEGSGTPTEPHHTPSPEAQQTSPTTHSLPTLPSITTAPIPIVTPSDTPHLRQYTRRARIAQSSALPPVADEPASPLRDVSQGEAWPTGFSLDAEQDMVNIAKTSTFPHESTSRVPSLAADEGSFQLRIQELMDLCTSLQRQQSDLVSKFEAQELEINRLKARVKLLEYREGGVAERSGDDAPIKGRTLDEGEAAAERVSNDTEEMATVLTSIDATSILTSGGVQVVPTTTEVATATISILTSSDVVPTASLIFATATIVTPYTRRKGKEKMVETDTPKKKKFQEQMDIQMARQLEEEMERGAQRMNEQIARDAEVARIYAEEKLQMMINSLDMSNENVLKYLQEYEQGMTFEEIEAKFTTVWKQIKNFIPMGSKEEAERFKRKGIRFEQESVKKLKTSEEVKASEEVPEEKVNEMMQLVPIEEVYVEALQVKHPIIDWNHLDREDLNQLWTLVKESLNIRPASSDKEMELWVELKRLYKLDVEDQLWTHTQNMMHAPVEWKLYDSCGVHHVASKDNETFMLIEKDYPLGKGSWWLLGIDGEGRGSGVEVVEWSVEWGKCTNVVNAPREPYVVKQDNGSFVDKIIFDLNRAPDSPNQFHCFHCKDVLRDGEACKRCTCAKCGSGLSKGLCYICGHNQNSLNESPRNSETSSQSPSNINHCCYECGDPLDDIFCKRCTSESPFTFDSTPTCVDESPNVFNPPPQPPV
nr:hypothetical protein [Tanacetum cinerariifolium]